MKAAIASLLLCFGASASHADDLYKPTAWSALSTDRVARQIGDTLTVVVFQTAEASNTAKSDSLRSTKLGGQLQGGSLDEAGSLSFGGGYSGGGQVQRSERFVTRISVTVREVLPNGDLIIVGEQRLRINGETSNIGVRGRVRPADVAGDNSVASSRIADAQIDYDGHGFVSKSARPGLINRVFRFLGLG